MLGDAIQCGAVWSAIPMNMESHYEPMIDILKDLPPEKRLERESQHMDDLQSDKKKWNRYYAISSGWVSDWLEYV